MNQIQIHKKIDELTKKETTSLKPEDLKEVLINLDAVDYFFEKVDISWFSWLLGNRFFEELKEKEMERKQLLPRLKYIEKVAKTSPIEVTDFILSLKISQSNFNHNVIETFLSIMEEVPIEQSKEIIHKLTEEKWLELRKEYRQTGYEFKKIVKKLDEAREAPTLIELASALLSVKTKIEKDQAIVDADDPFCVQYVGESNIFQALQNVDKEYYEDVLKMLLQILGTVGKQMEETKEGRFKYSDIFVFSYLDFFNIKEQDDDSISGRDNIVNLIKVITIITKEIFTNSNLNADAKRIYVDHFMGLPDSRTMWRLRLFALCQASDIFIEEIKKYIFEVFNIGDEYWQISHNPEYYHALKDNFIKFKEEERESYIEKFCEYFGGKDKEDKWVNSESKRILSVIKEALSPKQKQKINEIFGKLPAREYRPTPVSIMSGGEIISKSPEDIAKLSIEEILVKLKDEWIPEKLEEKYKSDNFLNPRNAEGVGAALKRDVKERFDEYIAHINEFFDTEEIHPHYLYSILNGIADLIRNGKTLNVGQILTMLNLFDQIKQSEVIAITENIRGQFLANWIAVYRSITNIIKIILEIDDEDVRKEFPLYRDQVLSIILFLLNVKESPSPEDDDPKYGDPYGVAINSVRGEAFEDLVRFVERDGKNLKEDVKEIYEYVLDDPSLAVHFVIGRYLGAFYYKDKGYTRSLFSKIFEKDNSKMKDIYLASWEGYLSFNIFKELFIELEEYYKYAIELSSDKYTKRKYVTGLDESLAVHLALAYSHFDFGLENDLFKMFWDSKNIKRQSEFISFMGRHCISRSEAGDKWFIENNVNPQKLIDFWDYALENTNKPEVLEYFGYWINPKIEVFDDKIIIEKIKRTLEKSNGQLVWDLGLLDSLTIWASKYSDNTLDIIINFLIHGDDLNKHRGGFVLEKENIIEALKIIIKNGDGTTYEKIENLINILLEKGGREFWDFKEILA